VTPKVLCNIEILHVIFGSVEATGKLLSVVLEKRLLLLGGALKPVKFNNS
jgi:hypothetical protein